MGNGAENQTVAPGAFRLREFVKRAAAGEELTIAFFGGSITQGSLASEERWCYAHRSFDLLKDRYPQAVLHYLNAGIGGTGSHYGVMRLWPDLLMYHPDLVVVDFSVNDTEAVLPLYTGDPGSAEAGAPIAHSARSSSFDKIYPETFEAVIRRVLSAEGAPAMIILNNAFYDTGESVEEEHNAIADHYGVPHVSVRDTILPRIRA
nr:SGNH/GDSL hydrolase family protein [Lachnospiraceae bacterium]